MNSVKKQSYRYAAVVVCLMALLVIIFFSSFLVGRFTGIDGESVIRILLYKCLHIGEKTWTNVAENIVMQVRLPRIIAATLVGATLSVSGASYQALFSNPMASPDTLGVSSGAGLGAAFGILLGWGAFAVEFSAFVIGCGAVIVVFFIASAISQGRQTAVFLVLTGMVVSSFLSALLSILKYIADPMDQLPAITYWLMGSFKSVTLQDIKIVAVLFLIGFLPLFLIRWRMNLLVLSEQEAKALGGNIVFIRVVTIVCSTLLTASAIAISGGIGWVGLVVPHIARFLVGDDMKRVIPISAIFGALYMLVMDDISRYLLVTEVPIGILTAIIGAPVFFVILLKNRGSVAHGN